jgi:hypothetical protein
MMDEFKMVDSYIGVNEIIVKTEKGLKEELLSILSRSENRVITLKSPDSGELTIGIGHPYGFVEFISETLEPPYMIAIDQDSEKSEKFYEFDAGGTPTPIPAAKCLPVDVVIDIVIYFYKNKELPTDIQWEKE